MSDRSLDDFLTEADDTETDETDRPADPDTSTESVDPAVATATLHADGAACESCGESASRRWLDDGAYVCGECKDW